MIDDQGRRVKEAGPSMPVEILGLSSVPEAGETFVTMDTEKEARAFAETYISEGKNQLVISIGCTGGKHRSVTLANELYKRLSQKKNREYGLKIEHRDIGKDALRGK